MQADRGGIAAWLCRTPLIIHEQNARAGSTNKILTRFATQVFQAFPLTFEKVRAATVGNPVREEIADLNGNQARAVARENESESKFNLLILGGSRGARFLNTHLPPVIMRLREQRPELKIHVRHQCGELELAATQKHYPQATDGIEVLPFIEDMAANYAWSDVVVCRAGAMTISELAAAGCASILVPFPFATDDHQTLNAMYLVERGAAKLIPQSDSFETDTFDALSALAEEPGRTKQMAANAQNAAVLDAARVVAKRCQELANA